MVDLGHLSTREADRYLRRLTAFSSSPDFQGWDMSAFKFLGSW